jgi:hypothetical protein
MRVRIFVACALIVSIAGTMPLNAFLEDLCLPRWAGGPTLSWCINPDCLNPKKSSNSTCPSETAAFITIKPGRSMVHADSTFFIAQALGYRSDVAYWIAAYNEVTDYSQYVPIDQCGVQAANQNAIDHKMTRQKASNSGQNYRECCALSASQTAPAA